MTWMDFLWSKI